MKFNLKRWGTVGLVLAMTTLLGCASPAAKVGDKQAADDVVITNKVIKVISGEATLNTAHIFVETSKGVVLLSGTVDSAAAENTATELARYVDGVTLVRDALQIKH